MIKGGRETRREQGDAGARSRRLASARDVTRDVITTEARSRRFVPKGTWYATITAGTFSRWIAGRDAGRDYEGDVITEVKGRDTGRDHG